MSAWANDYVGIPYALNGRDRSGVDCWGLVLLAFREQRGIELPDFQRASDALDDAIQVMSEGLVSVAGAHLAQRLDGPEPWAVAIAAHRHLPHHAGICLGAHVLHAQRGIGVVCAPFAYFRREYGELSYWRWEGSDGIARVREKSAGAG